VDNEEVKKIINKEQKKIILQNTKKTIVRKNDKNTTTIKKVEKMASQALSLSVIIDDKKIINTINEKHKDIATDIKINEPQNNAIKPKSSKTKLPKTGVSKTKSLLNKDKPNDKKTKEKEILEQKIKDKKFDKALIALMIEDYLGDKRYEAALKIAKAYYEIKNYKESLKWAIRANKMDDSDEGSWIVFAKANIELGNKLIASRVLKAYLKNHQSKKIKELYEKIKSSQE